MKKQLLSFGLVALAALNTSAQTSVTVSIGANYANQKWYSLANGEQGTAQSKDNWDLGFEINGYASTILANTQKANFAVYKTPFKIADYATLDTAGISTWPTLYNADDNWSVGALNRGANPANAMDLGWGVYDMNTHFVMGDSCYVVKLSATSYKKIKIISLASGTYNFEYANIDGTSPQVAALAKAGYTGKNFAYYDMTANAAVDREPVSSSWDLTFGRYTAFVPTPYPSVGILSNKGVKVAQANNVANPTTYTDWQAQVLDSLHTNIIGHDWKGVDIMTGIWTVKADTVYFVQDKAKNIWRINFVAFGGASNGNYVFNKTQLATVGIKNEAGNTISQVSVYPNPSNGDKATLLFSSDENIGKVSVSITDISGKLLSTETVNVASGLNTYAIGTAELKSGIYFIRLNANGNTVTQKLIKQ